MAEDVIALPAAIHPPEVVRRLTRDHIAENPDEHDQLTWAYAGNVYSSDGAACDTTACAGGRAVLIGLPGATILGARVRLHADQEGWPVEWVAQHFLGLTYDQSGALFWAAKTREQVLCMLELLIQDPEADAAAMLDAAGIDDDADWDDE